jgi:hypothetical protein
MKKIALLLTFAVVLPASAFAQKQEKHGRAGFDYRKEHSKNSVFEVILDTNDLESENVQKISDVLRHHPLMMQSLESPNQRPSTTFRSSAINSNGNHCRGFRYFVDGQLSPMTGDVIDTEYSPQTIFGLEIYRPGPQVPSEFSRGGEGCGAIVIWTH